MKVGNGGYLFILFFLVGRSLCSGQSVATFSSSNPSNLVVCGDAQSFTLKVTNKTLTDTLASGKLTLKLPQGFSYSKSSVSGTGVSESNVTNLNQPVFSIPDIKPRDSVKFTIKASADCGVISYINSGGILRNYLKLVYAAGRDSGYASSFSIGVPSLSISSITNQVYTGSVADTITRKVTITNTATGGLKSFRFYFIRGKGINVNSVSKSYTTSKDTFFFTFDATDFSKIGNKDNYFDKGESFTLIEKDSIIACTGLSNKYNVGWGCGTSTCQQYSSSSNIILANKVPVITVSTIPGQSICYTNTTANQQSVTLYNSGSATAKNILLDIMQTGDVNYGYNNLFKSRIDEKSIEIKYGSGSFTSIQADSTFVTTNYGCMSTTDPKGRFWLKIKDLKPTDAVTIRWNVYDCCLDQGYINGWGYKVTYSDVCLNTLTTQGMGRVYNYQYFGTPSANSSDLVVGDTLLLSLQNTYTSNALLPGSGLKYLQYEITVPAGVRIDTAGLVQVDDYKTVTWKPDSIRKVKNVIYVSFGLPEPKGFLYTGSRLLMRVWPDTSKKAAACGDKVNLGIKLSYNPNAGCGCIGTLFNTNYPLTINCANPDRVGMYNAKFSFVRTSFGLPDNNDDGKPDGFGTLDFSKVKTDRAMFGDTMTASFTGKVFTNTTYPNWRYAFADLKFTSDYLSHLDIVLKVKDSSTGNYYTCTKVPFRKTGSNFYYYYGIDSLIAAGCSSFPSNFKYENGDSVWITTRFKVTKNTKDEHYLVVDADYYFGTKSNPSSLFDHYSMKRKWSDFHVIGYYFTAWGSDNLSTNGCNNLAFSESYYLSIGACCSNYYGGNKFPYEYRYWAKFSSMKVLMPTGYKFQSGTIYYYPTTGTGKYGNYSTPLKVSNTIGDTLVFNVDSLYKPLGTFPLSDDGYAGTINIIAKPGCGSPAGTAAAIKYWQYYKQADILGGGTTPAYTDADYVTLKPAAFTVQPALSPVSVYADTFSWDLFISNSNLSGGTDYSWLAFQSKSGKISIDSVWLNTYKAPESKGIYHIDKIFGGATKKVTIKARMKNCESDSIKVYFGWDCTDYPDTLADVKCAAQTVTLYADPKLPNLQLTSLGAADSIDLCDTLKYTLAINNAQSGSASDVDVHVFMQQGTHLVKGKSTIRYPMKTSYRSIADPDSVGPYEYVYHLSKYSSAVNTHGFPGYLDSANSSFRLGLKVVTDCDFISGTGLSYLAIGKNACGNPVTAAMYDEKPIKLIGAKTGYYSTITITGKTSANACGKPPTLKVKFTNFGPVRTDSLDYFFIDLPKGIRYVNNSMVGDYKGPASGSLKIDTLGNAVRYGWRIQKGIVSGDSSVFHFSYQADSTIACGTYSILAQATTNVKLTCVSTKVVCDIKVPTGIASKKIQISKPKLSISNYSVTALPAPPSQELLTVKADIKNSGDTLFSGTSVFRIYFDSDGNKKLSAPDYLLHTDTLKNGLNPNSIYKLNSVFPAAAGKTCGIILSWDSSGTNCACSSVQSYFGPVQLLSAGKDTGFCSGFGLKIGRDSISGYSYSWAPATGLSNTKTARPILTVINKGTSNLIQTYVVTVTRGTSCVTKDTVVFSISPQMKVSAGGVKTICSGDSVKIGGSPTVSGTSTYRYSWTPTAGLSDPTIANPYAKPGSTTTYYVVVKDANDCGGSDSAVVTVRQSPVADAGSDKEICPGDTVKIGGSPSASGTNSPFNILWSPSTGLSSEYMGNPYAYPSKTTTYVLKITDVKGCIDYDTMILTVNPVPKVNAGGDVSICLADSVTLGGKPTASGAAGPYHYKWSPSTGLSNDSVANPVAKPSSTTSYVLRVIDSKGCKNSDTIKVTVNSHPIVNAGKDTIICRGSTIKIGGSPAGSGGKTPYSYYWTPAAGLSNRTSANPNANPSVTSIYTLVITDANGCSATDSVRIQVNPLPVVSAGSDDTLCNGDTVLLKGVTGSIYRHYWTPGKLVTDSTSLNVKAFPGKTTAFILRSTDSLGCSSTDTMVAYVRSKIALKSPLLRCVDVTTDSSIRLNWDTIRTNDEFKSYKIYRRGGAGSFTLIAVISDRLKNSFVDYSASSAGSVSYSYYVAVINKCGIESKAGDTLNSVVLSTSPIGDKTLDLSWNSFSSKRSLYEIWSSNSSGNQKIGQTTSNSYRIRSCDFSALYRLVVKDTGCSSHSNYSKNILLKDSTPPSANSILLTTVDNWNQVTVKFKSSDSSDTREYRVYMADTSGIYSLIKTVPSIGSGSYSIAATSVTANKSRYYFKILSVDTCGNTSLYSGVQSPVLLRGKAGNLRSVLTWRKYVGATTDSIAVQKYIGGKWTDIKLLGSADSSYTDSLYLGCKQSYYYRIQTKIGTLYSYSDSVIVIPFDTVSPQKVNIIDASVVDNGSVDVTFNRVADQDVDHYDIYTSRNHGSFLKVGAVSRPKNDPVTFRHTGINTLADTFSYQVKAVDSCNSNTSLASEMHSVVSLHGQAADYAAWIRWSPYRGFTVKSYVVQKLSGNKWTDLAILNPNDSAYRDSLIPCRLKQYYRIKTIENNGDNGVSYSDSVQVTPFDTIRPLEPVIVNVSIPSNGKVSLAWNKSSSTDVRNYIIYRDSGKGYDSLASVGDIDTFTDAGLNPFTSYCYAIRAKDSCAGNKSGLSPPHCSIALTTSVKGCEKAIYLNWNSYKGGKGVLKYEVYRKINSGVESRLTSVSESYTFYKDSGLDYHNTYCYRVKAILDSSSAISYSNSDCARVFFVDTPHILFVTKLNTSAGAGKVRIKWKLPNSLSHLDHYDLYYADNSKSFSLLKGNISIKQDSFIHGGINTQSGDHYYYLVTVDSCSGSSEHSEIHKTMDLTFSVGQLVHRLNWTPYYGWPVKYYIAQLSTGGVLSDLDTIAGTDTALFKFPAPCNTRLYYRIKAVSYNNEISYSDTMGGQAIDTIPSNAPVILNASITSGKSAAITFIGADSSDTYGYYILRSVAGGAFKTAGFINYTGPGKSYVFTDSVLTTKNQLCYKVVTVDSCLNATNSEEFCPIQLEGKNGNLANRLWWSTFKGYPIKKYLVSLDVGGVWQPIATTTDTFFNHDSLSCNVPRTYQITGYSSSGSWTTFSDTIILTPFDTVRPKPPVLEYATVLSGKSIYLKWKYSPDKKVKEYEIQLRSSGGQWQKAASVFLVDNYIVGNLNTLDSAYDFRIIAIDTCAANRSIYSDVHREIQLSGDSGNLSNTIKWSPYKGFTVDRYIISKWKSGSWTKIDSVGGGTFNYLDTGLQCMVPYFYCVSAISASGYLSNSDTISLTPFDTVRPPSPVINMASVVSDGSILLSWNKSVPKVRQYEIWQKTANGSWKAAINVFDRLTWTFNGLNTADSVYDYKVIAIDTCRGNRSSFSAMHSPVQLDGSPGNLTATLKWKPYEGFAVSQYLILFRKGNVWNIIDSVSGTITSYTDKGLACNVNRNYKVAAKSAVTGLISLSDSIWVMPFDTIKPPTPLFRYATVYPGGKVKVAWHWDRSSDVKYFEVWKSTNKKPPVLTGTVTYDSSFIDSGANPQQDILSYSVIAIDSCNSLNRSGRSEEDTLNSLAAFTGGCKPQVTLTWRGYKDLPQGTKSYEIYRSVDNGPFTRQANTIGYKWKDVGVDTTRQFVYSIKAISYDTSAYSFTDTIGIRPWVFPVPKQSELVSASVVKSNRVFGAIQLDWKHYDFNTDTFARGYRVYYGPTLSGPFVQVFETTDTSITSFIHDGINTETDNHYYYLKVFSVCNVEGIRSEIHSPANISLVNKNHAIDLSWKPYEGFSPLYGYELYRSINGASFSKLVSLTTSVTSFTDTAVRCGDVYYYRLKSLGGGVSSWSDSIGATAFDTIAPAPPVPNFISIRSTGKTTGSVYFNFIGSSDPNRKGFILFRTDDGINYLPADTILTAKFSSVTWQSNNQNTYDFPVSFYLRGIDSCSNISLPSDTHRTVHLIVKAVSGRNILKWTSYIGWKTYLITVERKKGGGPWTPIVRLNSAVSGFTDSMVKCDTQYSYRVAVSSGNFISLSNSDSVKAFETDPPVAPLMTSVSVLKTGFTDGIIKIKWTISVSKDVSYYTLYRNDGAGYMIIANRLNANSFIDSFQNTSQQHLYYVLAVDSCRNNSAASAGIHKNIVLKAQPENQSVSLTWTPYTGWAVDRYIVFRNGKYFSTVSGNSNSFVDTPALCPVQYQYQVAAINKNDSTVLSFSNIDSAAAFDAVPPKAIKLKSVSVLEPNKLVEINWSASHDFDIKGYKLLRQVPPKLYFSVLRVLNSPLDTSYIDTVDRISSVICYKILPYDGCGNIGDTSNNGCLILIKGKPGNLSNSVGWNPYQNWPGGVDHYNLYRKSDSTNYTLVGSFDDTTFNCTDSGFTENSRNYCYRIEAVENGGFSATSWSTEVCLEQSPVVWIPNAFTPGASFNLNDYFGPKGLFIASYRMEIYNRWGQQVYKSEDSKPWNGYQYGTAAEEGVYMYRITVHSYNGNDYFYRGNVMVVK